MAFGDYIGPQLINYCSSENIQVIIKIKNDVFLIIIFKYLLTTGSVSKQDKTKRLATWTVKQLKKIQRNVNGH